jgi:glycosyltransferase involved in cell wall biosynthesis
MRTADMKVCFVGHFADGRDEGVRNVGKYLNNELGDQGLETTLVDMRSLVQWRKIVRTNPDIVHFILTPTTSGIIAAKLLSVFQSHTKVVISAIHPAVPRRRALKFFKPDLMLVQSKGSEELFNAIGFRTRTLPNGVDLTKFKPVSSYQKIQLRHKYGIPEEAKIVLHLASLRKERNLGICKRIQKAGLYRVLIVGRKGDKNDPTVMRELQDAGCLVWVEHFAHIEDIYNIADCYLFPTKNKKACIETPLSVLEAMACNLPIITTRFGALPELFSEGYGFFFAESDEISLQRLRDLRDGTIHIATREMVLSYSWENIANQLREIYVGLLHQACV